MPSDDLSGNLLNGEFRRGASPATHTVSPMGGRVGERAGTVERVPAHFQADSTRSRATGRRILFVAPVLFALLGAAAGGGDATTLEQLRAGDVRLATIGHRLAVANAALCADRVPRPGIVFHAIDQYDAAEQPDARRVFGFAGAIGVEGVVPGSAAARAGIRANDSIVALGGQAVPTADGAGHVRTRDAFAALLDAQNDSQPLRVTLRRAEGERTVTLAPSPGCRTLFELRPGPSSNRRYHY